MKRQSVKVVRTVKDLRKVVAGWRKAGDKVALIPTMGALHDGHLQLVRAAQKKAPRTVTSIFVNPTQFAPHEDLARYPRDEAGDLAKLKTVDCDLVWAPGPAEMYPEGFATRVVPAGAAEGLETDYRSHFFGGVATVCCKLFTQVGPDFAMFGEKDYQQLQVIKRMVRDLAMPFEIVGMPTVREKDGLAMSSRNRYMSADERTQALGMYRQLVKVADTVRDGKTSCAEATAAASQALRDGGFDIVEYFTVVDAESLKPLEHVAGPARVIAAARLGRTRLIDNLAV